MNYKLSSKFISIQSQSQWELYFQRKDTMSNLDFNGAWTLNSLKLPKSRDVNPINLNDLVDIAADSCDILYLLNPDNLEICYVLENNFHECIFLTIDGISTRIATKIHLASQNRKSNIFRNVMDS